MWMSSDGGRNTRKDYTCTDIMNIYSIVVVMCYNSKNVINAIVTQKQYNFKSFVLKNKATARGRRCPPAAIKMPQKTKFISTN